MNRFRLLLLSLLAATACLAASTEGIVPGRWSVERAQAWAQAHPWYAGCNFLPANAINQLEMWQADTFDPATIDRDLGYAEDLGFRSMRVFLHDLAWRQDPEGFLKRMDQYLTIADRHHLTTLFVFFDSCWDPQPRAGKQRAPRPFVHNSGWVQSPGAHVLVDDAAQDGLEGYVKAVLQRFGQDRRVVAWDLFNEPDNTNHDSYGNVELPDKARRADRLLPKVFAWARAVNPSQPLR